LQQNLPSAEANRNATSSKLDCGTANTRSPFATYRERDDGDVDEGSYKEQPR
jgi:hypothetical protein